jgi:hypothetical protein
MVDFIRDHKALYGVEAICQILPIASSTYYRQLDLVQNPESVRNEIYTINIMLSKLS